MPPKSVKPGVFFDPRQELPRGRHAQAPDEVIAVQRERLMVAFTELMADDGYFRVRVGDIAKRAGVSLSAFYNAFLDKEQCAFAGYDRFIEILLRRVGEGLGSSDDWGGFVTQALEGYLGTLQADNVVSKAYQLEMDALGADSRSRRYSSLDGFARVLYDAQREMSPRDRRLHHQPLEVHRAIVYAVRQLACDLIDSEDEPDLLAMVPVMREWIVAGAYGPDQTEQRESLPGGRPHEDL